MNHLIAAMRIFLKVVDTQGFSRAADQLHLSPSSVTRHINELESHLGVRLLQRSTRRTALTDVGARYAEGCRTLLSDLEKIESCAMRESCEIAGELHVVVLASLISPELAALFADFQARHAEVSLRLTLTESEVDLLSGGFDVGIVADTMVTSISLVSRTLARGPLVAVASPAYLMNAPAPKRPVDLIGHQMIALATHGKTYCWTDRNRAKHSVHIDARFAVDSALMQRQIALAGAGIALLPEFLVANDLRIGTLTQVLGGYQIVNDEVTIKIVYPAREFLPGKVRAFVDLAVSHFDLPSIPPRPQYELLQHEVKRHDQEALSA